MTCLGLRSSQSSSGSGFRWEQKRGTASPPSRTTGNAADRDGTVRIQKFLSRAGVSSRRAAEGLIREGQVRVNGMVVTTLGARVDPDL
ncbi:MAG TPA: hypothetical protein DIU18_04650, partial [Gemmatimonadetes bacterium]|nr:hypothetical protein [Gemmatimonadota bacterium]